MSSQQHDKPGAAALAVARALARFHARRDHEAELAIAKKAARPHSVDQRIIRDHTT